MAKLKTTQKKGKSKRDFGPHDSRVREMSSAKLAQLAEQGNYDAIDEIKRRGPVGAAAKAQNKAKKAARRDASTAAAQLKAAAQADHSGDARKIRIK